MSLLPPSPVINAHVVDIANQTKRDALEFVKSAASIVENNIRRCWNDPQHTPQEFFNQFGQQAAASLALNSDLVQIVMKYESATGIEILDRGVLALVGTFAVNDNGTVTVSA